MADDPHTISARRSRLGQHFWYYSDLIGGYVCSAPVVGPLQDSRRPSPILERDVLNKLENAGLLHLQNRIQMIAQSYISRDAPFLHKWSKITLAAFEMRVRPPGGNMLSVYFYVRTDLAIRRIVTCEIVVDGQNPDDGGGSKLPNHNANSNQYNYSCDRYPLIRKAISGLLANSSSKKQSHLTLTTYYSILCFYSNHLSFVDGCRTLGVLLSEPKMVDSELPLLAPECCRLGAIGDRSVPDKELVAEELFETSSVFGWQLRASRSEHLICHVADRYELTVLEKARCLTTAQSVPFSGAMTPSFYNTLTRRKEAFTPIDPQRVRLYACGPTVYDYLHIGNGRMLIVFDVLFRLLRHVYGAEHVVYVRNITDVDDKINARAAERNISIRTLTDEMIAIFRTDAAALGCLPPTVEPRATDHIAPMIAIMQKLIANGHAYAAQGHVLFDVPSMPDYGRLTNRTTDEQIAGARIEVAPYKRCATDFVLWKPSSADEPGWDSPWGRGRPGWHLECSAMSWQHLGETFDIHGGGIDLAPVHHENEIAQSRCAFGHAVMANVWMHNGHLQVEGEKMSKSLGNFITIYDLWNAQAFGGRKWIGDALRLAMLRTHYRQPIDFTLKALEEADRTVTDFSKACAGVAASRPSENFLAAMADDLNTPRAIAELHALRQDDPAALRAGLDLLGIVASAPELEAPSLAPEAEQLLERRLAARAEKNWAESDRLRDALAGMGIAVKDNKDGTTSWTTK